MDDEKLKKFGLSKEVFEGSLTCFLQNTYGGNIIALNIPKPDLSREEASITFQERPNISDLSIRVNTYFEQRGYKNMNPKRIREEDMFSAGYESKSDSSLASSVIITTGDRMMLVTVHPC